jgi:pyruvate kinase
MRFAEAEILQADAIITATSSEHGCMVANIVLDSKIIAVTRMKLSPINYACFGSYPVLNPITPTIRYNGQRSYCSSLRCRTNCNGDLVLLTSGIRAGVPGSTNMMQIITVGDVLCQGMCIGNRAVVGRAVGAVTPEDALLHMKPGDILVTKSVDGDYLPAIRIASALVTEEGGLLLREPSLD